MPPSASTVLISAARSCNAALISSDKPAFGSTSATGPSVLPVNASGQFNPVATETLSLVAAGPNVVRAPADWSTCADASYRSFPEYTVTLAAGGRFRTAAAAGPPTTRYSRGSWG